MWKQRKARRTSRVSRKRFGAVTAMTMATALVVAGCSSANDSSSGSGSLDSFGYQLSTPLVTTNAATNLGDSMKAQRLSGRVFPGAFIPGPSGQRIPNTDLVQTQVLPGSQRQVVYTLTDKAVFSDGVPVTCDDYKLAFVAGSHPEVFSSHLPQMQQVDRVDCAPGAKEFTVVFKEGKGGRWRELFGAGTVLPAHAVAKKLGMETAQLTRALEAADPDVLARTSTVWRYGFGLSDFDPELQVSFGPYKIDSVGAEGEVTLVANEQYYGEAPELEKIVVWPSTKDSAELQAAGALMVGDLDDHNPGWYDAAPDPGEGANADDAVAGDSTGDSSGGDSTGSAKESLDPSAPEAHQELQTVIGEMTDTLIFADFGPWAVKEKRQALSKCVDNQAVADASSSIAGIELPVSPVHVLNHNDPMTRNLGDIAQPHLAVDIEGAKEAEGLELRIGYLSPSKRYAAMVEAIRRSCEPAGITVIDATGDGKTRGDLFTEDHPANEHNPNEEMVDAYLGAVDPMAEYETSVSRSEELPSLRSEEHRLWDELPSIPLSAQPRTFIVDKNIQNVVVYTGPVGIGWNMDRWQVPGSNKRNKKAGS